MWIGRCQWWPEFQVPFREATISRCGNIREPTKLTKTNRLWHRSLEKIERKLDVTYTSSWGNPIKIQFNKVLVAIVSLVIGKSPIDLLRINLEQKKQPLDEMGIKRHRISIVYHSTVPSLLSSNVIKSLISEIQCK